MMTAREQDGLDRANRSERVPVVFVHGLWLLSNCWDSWRRLFEDAGYVALAPGWPDDPATVEAARQRPEAFADKSIREVTDHFAEIVARLARRPAVIGHSFGGLVAEQLAARGLSAATVAISPAPFRGVLPLPLSALRAAFPVLRSPANLHRAVSLSYAQFRYAFANAVAEEEARRLYDRYAVAAAGRPLFQAATANLHPGTEAAVDTRHDARGPLLIITSDEDHTMPRAIAAAAFARQRRNRGLTELRELPHRGHSLVFDSGWREVADVALAFVEQHHASGEIRRPRPEEARPGVTP